MVALPRVVIAAPATGQGKTTIATGLMAALGQAGHKVSGHKVGPDYIDPGYHALATGRPGHNLDPHLVGEQRVVPLLLHGAAGADVAVIEGVMGLYDGRLGTDGFASTAHVAALTQSPVLLVLDVGAMSRSAAAIALGMDTFGGAPRVAGVVLNRAGSDANTAEIARALEQAGLCVVGVLPRDPGLTAPSRHLGLVPAAERADAVAMILRLGEQVAAHLDLDAILDLARSAAVLDADSWDPSREVRPVTALERPVIAMAGGRAFTFRYAETEELLTAAGCEVVTFDPLRDCSLPAGTQGIYLGGGFPEVHAAELAANVSLLAELRDAIVGGVPTVAECAGLLYLTESVDGVPMAGVLPARAAMSERLTLRYPVATAARDSLLTQAGEQVSGHEFHRTQTSPQSGSTPAWQIEGDLMGYADASLHASYLHVHWAGHPQLAQRFADAAARARPIAGRPVAPALAPAEPRSAEAGARDAQPIQAETPHLLAHHGDAETGPGLLDFAVNVYDGDRPDWLETALTASLDAAAHYPDPTAARTVIAGRHGRELAEVLPTAGAAEAFTLIARRRRWRRPVVVHPQFTEPHAALQRAGLRVTSVLCRPEQGFALDPRAIPEDADVVFVGQPTNPTGVLHPAATLRALCRPGRLVVVDEAFMDVVPDEAESLGGSAVPGLLIVRSLTKHWSIPGLRAGYVLGDSDEVGRLAEQQTPWSVSTPAIAAIIACLGPDAVAEARRRTREIASWREHLQGALDQRGIVQAPSVASFVLARVGAGVHAGLRDRGIAVRRADTFPGLDAAWVRIAVRRPAQTERLLAALDSLPTSSEVAHD